MRRMLIRWWRQQRGSAAIEFALVAWPYLVLLFGIIEMGVLTAQAAVMDAATRAAARQLRTGVVQGQADPLQAFQTLFCRQALLAPCSTFFFDVRNFQGFAQISLPPLTFDKDNQPTNATFQPGGPGTVVTVRVVHLYSFLTPLVGTLISPSASITLQSTAVFMTEPFPP